MSKPPYDPFYIALFSVATPFPPAESIPFLQAHADRLGIACHCEINEQLVIAEPGGKEPEVLDIPCPSLPSESRSTG